MQEHNNYETLLGKAQSSDIKTLLQEPAAYFESNASKELLDLNHIQTSQLKKYIVSNIQKQ